MLQDSESGSFPAAPQMTPSQKAQLYEHFGKCVTIVISRAKIAASVDESEVDLCQIESDFQSLLEGEGRAMNDRADDFASFSKELLSGILVYDPLDREIPGISLEGTEVENVAASREEMLAVIREGQESMRAGFMSAPITPQSRFTLDQLFKQQQDLVNKVIESHIDMAQTQGQEFRALLKAEPVV